MKHLAPKACLTILLAGVVVPPAMAAHYCLRNQVIPPICIYDDPAECQKDANRQGAECDVNPNEIHLNAQFGKYCVVTAGGVSDCNYTDPGTCSREAAQKGGACAPSPGHHPLQAPNPYSPVEGY
ncbi:MAG: hypothetical protein B7Z80_20620 [Rhodospirillales bacterium 20-64-7]|nr:MAG: hypothetical protein B7Z80_20620 [Rhodospirillales bacterium 20-64-7]HQT78747.1 hypothetical protein [Rhodopila sp.]